MTSRKSTARRLIEARVREMNDGYYMDGYAVEYDDDEDVLEYPYTCLDSGMQFETYDEFATFSPFTGSTNISADIPYEDSYEEDPYYEEDQMKTSDVPPSQKDPFKQNPTAPNPVSAGAKPKDWDNKPVKSNPAPDASGQVGADTADGKGYVK